MKIIDKNKDYYDYLQQYDDTLVYDRRGSYPLTKFDVIDKLWGKLWEREATFQDKYMLLQIGCSFYLILVKCTEKEMYEGITKVKDYSLELEDKWKDYGKYDSLHFGEVKCDYSIEFLFSKNFNVKAKLVDDIKHGNYKHKYDFTESHKDLNFANIKIPSIISAEEMFYSFEDYFSHLKDDKTHDDMSDIEKIESHGFDKKYSFRGK